MSTFFYKKMKMVPIRVFNKNSLFTIQEELMILIKLNSYQKHHFEIDLLKELITLIIYLYREIFSMLSLFSLSQSSELQTNLAKVTQANLEAPDEKILKKIIGSLLGEDQTIRSQIAFVTILQYISNSSLNNNWMFLLKCLILLDKIVMEKIFLDEISQLSFKIFENYQEHDKKYKLLSTENIVTFYWKSIKQRAKALKSKKRVISYLRSQRQNFIQNKSADETFKELQTIRQLYLYNFYLLSYLIPNDYQGQKVLKQKQQLEKTKLISFINLQILYTLFVLQSCESICIKHITDILCETNFDRKSHQTQPSLNYQYGNPERTHSQLIMNTSNLSKFKYVTDDFKKHSHIIMNFIERHKTQKGFNSLTKKDLDPLREFGISKKIQELVESCQNEKLSLDFYVEVRPIPFSPNQQKMKVFPKSNGKKIGNQIFSPRKQMKKQTNKNEGNPFLDWYNTYSDEFPTKSMLTVDLIQDWKSDPKTYKLYVKN